MTKKISGHLKLKHVTLQFHEAVEQSYPFAYLLNNPTTDVVSDVLGLFHSWHSKIESKLEMLNQKDSMPFLSLVISEHIVLFKFLALYKTKTVGSLSSNNMSLTQDEYFKSLGYLYVFLGSALGAKLVLNKLEPLGKAYLAPLLDYYRQTINIGRHWPTYLTELNELAENETCQFEAIQKGAIESFKDILTLSDQLSFKNNFKSRY